MNHPLLIAYSSVVAVCLLWLLWLGFRTRPKNNNKPSEAESIRGISDSDLQFVHTQNLVLVSLARMMEAQGVDDQPLIDELYRRGRNGFVKKPKEPTMKP